MANEEHVAVVRQGADAIDLRWLTYFVPAGGG